MIDPGLLAELAGIVGSEHAVVDPDIVGGYEVDWTRRFRGTAAAVLRPGSTEEVAAVVAACARVGAAVVPQGGNTGTVGGGVPRGGEIVLSLRRLDGIEDPDPLAAQVTAGAGATLAAVQARARPFALELGVDLPSRDAATIGGMIATNAGGMGVFRYGSMRRQVLGVEAVLADGRVIERLSGLVKDNSGYDLAGLVTGSEGTLAVVTRARLRLVPTLPERATALVPVRSLETALTFTRGLRARLSSLVAAEFLSRAGLEVGMWHWGVGEPTEPGPWYLLVECAGPERVDEEMIQALEAGGATSAAFASDSAAFATDRADRAGLWRYRDGLAEALNAETVPIKLDVSLPLAALGPFCERCPEVVREVLPTARTVLFGHLLDGNVHVNVNDPAVDPSSDLALVERIELAVLELVVAHGGSISAEHGIGVAKASFLRMGRRPDDIAAMRAIKAALDPAGILNPGVIFG